MGHRFALMTFEQSKYKLEFDQASEMRRKLKDEGIFWYPLPYHKRFSLIATAFDCLSGVLRGIGIAIRHKPRVVHSRASIPAAIALAIAFVCRLKFLYDADSRLSEEYADTGHWSRTGLAFRVTAWIEARARNRANSIVVLSERLRLQFEREFLVRAPITVIPCCVAIDEFRYSSAVRDSRRAQLNLDDEKLLVYVGKTGSRYLVNEMFEFFRTAREKIGRLRLLILSADSPDSFQRIADEQAIPRTDYSVIRASRGEVSEWLSAADAGLAFIRSAGCETGSSPIKIGEYLAEGLPVVITSGIGDYSELIERENLGVVIRDLDTDGYRECADSLVRLWAEQDRVRQHCQEAARRYVSLDGIGAIRYRNVYEGLLAEA